MGSRGRSLRKNERIEEYFKAGFTKVYVQSTSPNEIEFIEEFGSKVLPHFKNIEGQVVKAS